MIGIRPMRGLVAGAALVVAACSGGLRLESRSAVGPVTVDGTTSEWSGRLVRVGSGEATVGVQHDERTVYVSFITRERSSMAMIMMGGFTVWFDPSGGKHHRLGVRFPLGLAGRASARPGEPTRPLRPGEDAGGPAPQGGPLHLIDEMGGVREFGPDAAPGVRVRAATDMAGFVYELSVDRSLIAEAGVLGPVLGVGFETGELEFGSPGGAAGGPPTAAGGAGGRGGRRGGGGGGLAATGAAPSEGGPSGMPRPVKIWARVTVTP